MSAPPPSSFDGNVEFYTENRWQKFKRRLFEEPLIPLGCALTCWALFEATKSIRSGDKHRTNRMFRRRIYAQGFTILAMLGGSAYWKTDREKRKQFEGLTEEKKRKEKHQAWIKELEARDEEQKEMEVVARRRSNGDGNGVGGGGQTAWSEVKSVCEDSERKMLGTIADMAMDALGWRWR